MTLYHIIRNMENSQVPPQEIVTSLKQALLVSAKGRIPTEGKASDFVDTLSFYFSSLFEK